MTNILNPQQQNAVEHVSGPLLVIAGAGSGKTRVISEKIAHLLGYCKFKTNQIIAVTFTNKAAQEMKQRINKRLTSKQTRGLIISTFHSLGLKLIREQIAWFKLNSNFSILDTLDSKALLEQIIDNSNQNLNIEVDVLHAAISRYKSQLITPKIAQQQAADNTELLHAQIYEDYNRYLVAYNAVDFDDLIYLPVTMLQSDENIRKHYQQKIRYILVDEYQDTNDSQYSLIKLLTDFHQCFTVVGDDDQSIYSWRGAKPENMNKLKEDYYKLKVIKLEQNYRSKKRILKVANALINHNEHVFEKTLWSNLGEGDTVKIIANKNEFIEAERIAQEIHKLKFTTNCKYKDIAILYRSNYQAKPLEKALRERKIPYKINDGTSFFDRSEIKDIMAYCRLLINPDDDLAFLRIANTPRREIGPATIEALGKYASNRKISLLNSCFEFGLTTILNEKQINNIQAFANWLNQYSIKLINNESNEDEIKIINDMISAMDYNTWLIDTSSSPKAAEKRMENVKELLTWISNIQKQSDDDTSSSFADVIKKMCLLEIIESNTDEDKNKIDQINLLTLHGAKGLEFPHVFLIGFEEEILPHKNSLGTDMLEEERRLAYVGITRAQETLTITYAQTRKKYGEEIDCIPSRFLTELPEKELSWLTDAPIYTEKENESIADNHLNNLHAMLEKFT